MNFNLNLHLGYINPKASARYQLCKVLQKGICAGVSGGMRWLFRLPYQYKSQDLQKQQSNKATLSQGAFEDNRLYEQKMHN